MSLQSSKIWKKYLNGGGQLVLVEGQNNLRRLDNCKLLEENFGIVWGNRRLLASQKAKQPQEAGLFVTWLKNTPRIN
jgi:hypothetical protein